MMQLPGWASRIVALALLASPFAVHAAPPATGRATMTILNGQAQFIRGLSRFVAAEGVRLESGDIVTTGPGAFVQLEFDGGTRVQLGPQTQWMLLSHDIAVPPRRAAYLLSGWAKLTSGQKTTDAPETLRAAGLEVTGIESVSVMKIDGDGAAVFAETGKAHLLERGPGRTVSERAMRAGEYYTRRATHAGAVQAHPTPEFVGQIPALFRDAVPPRLDSFRDRTVKAMKAPDFTYADVEPWLKSEAPLRRQLVERWKSKANDPAFRRALEAHLHELPEWNPILYPPKEDTDTPEQAPSENPAAPARALSESPAAPDQAPADSPAAQPAPAEQPPAEAPPAGQSPSENPPSPTPPS